MGNTVERTINAKQFSTSGSNSTQLKSLGANDGGTSDGNKNISRDLFSSTCESPNESVRSIKLKSSHKQLLQSPQPNDGFDALKSPLYSDFKGDLKTTPTATLTPIAVHRLNSSGTHAFSTPTKNISISSTSTPTSFKQSSAHLSYSNRSGNSQSRNTTTSYNSRHLSSNDSRSFDDSSTCFDTSVGMKHSHEKSKDKRSANTSSICLGDFLTPLSTKQHKARKSLNSTERSPTPVNVSHEKDFPSFTPKGKAVNRVALTPAPASLSPALTATPASKSNQTVKPSKRVVPTRIGATSNEFNCPAFRSDNNILELEHEENAVCTRDLLKSQKDMIRRVFQEEQPPETNLRILLHENLSQAKKMPSTKNAVPIDLNQITNKPMLDKFIDIYSIVLDLNLVTNVLTEVAYLVNLINLDVDEYYERNPHMLDCNNINDRTNTLEPTAALSKINAVVGEAMATKTCTSDTAGQLSEQQGETANRDVALNSSTCTTAVASVDDINAAILLLKNINNCVYFGLGVLQLQKNILRMLDVTSIKVLLENERLTTLDATIKDDLMTVYSHKMQLNRLLRAHDTPNRTGVTGWSTPLLAANNSMKVFYQQEQDTQMNFPSARESAAFKKQRDHFYSILGYVLMLACVYVAR